ncbi:MAG: YihY/virulence factor BrkB family protein [Ilumatobacter sp.]
MDIEESVSRPSLHWRTALSAVVDVVRETYESWREDRTLRLGAGLAYYALFTIVPFFAVTAALAEYLFGLTDLSSFHSDRLEQVGIVDAEAAGAAVAEELGRGTVQTTLGIVGVGTLLFASTLAFLALVDAINTIWNVPVRSGIRNSVRRRLVSLLMALATGVVLIAAVLLSTVANAVERFVPGSTELVGIVSSVIDWLASSASLAIALTLLFRYIGPVRTQWVPTAFAAAATAFLMVVGAEAISWYLVTYGGSSLSGAFGAVLFMLSWVYYEAQILLGGVQLVKVLSRRHGLIADRGGE